MNAILIDTHKRAVGSIILKESLKVLSVQEETNWFTHSVWRFEEGEQVRWINKKAKGRQIELVQREGCIIKIEEGLAYIKAKTKRYTIPIYQLFPQESKPLMEMARTLVSQSSFGG